MRSVVRPLTSEEASALIHRRKRARIIHYMASHPDSTETPDEIEESAVRAEDIRLTFSTLNVTRYPDVTLSDAEETALRTLKEKITDAIRECAHREGEEEGKERKGGSGVFLKLSCRSPKDAALLSPSFADVFSEEVHSLLLERELIQRLCSSLRTPIPFLDIIMCVAFCRSSLRSLRVRTSEEAMDLLFESQRIFDDLLVYQSRVSHGIMRWDMEVLVREWDDIDPACEVRAYVMNGRVTAMGQYQMTYFVPFFLDGHFRESMQSAIFALIDQILPHLPFKDFAIDFAPLQSDHSKIQIIEINPPPPMAGTPMFQWADEEDRSILQNGPFEFRFIQEPDQDCVMSVPPQWRQKMKEMVECEHMDTIPTVDCEETPQEGTSSGSHNSCSIA